MKISNHITLAEAIKSQTAIRKGIDNNPNNEQIEAMKLVANMCFEPLREWHGKPIGISSFFRSTALNRLSREVHDHSTARVRRLISMLTYSVVLQTVISITG